MTATLIYIRDGHSEDEFAISTATTLVMDKAFTILSEILDEGDLTLGWAWLRGVERFIECVFHNDWESAESDVSRLCRAHERLWILRGCLETHPA